MRPITTRAGGRIAGALALALLLGAGGGCSLLRDAEISEMVPGGDIGGGKLECWLTIEFTGEPGGDPQDVRVVFDGNVLAAPQEFDWAYIAANDKIPQGFMKGFKPNKATAPDADPPVGVPVKVRYRLEAMPFVELSPGETLSLEATLYWAGEKQGSLSRTVEHVYSRQG